MDLGALTTVFTPPSSCLASSALWWIYTSCFAGPDCVYQLQGPPDLQDCFPPGYVPKSTAFYSPGVCPSGYTPACTSFITTGTVIKTLYTCCPTVQPYTCQGPSDEWPWQPTLACASDYTDTTTFPRATVISSGSTIVSTSLVWTPPGAINAYGVQVLLQSPTTTLVTYAPVENSRSVPSLVLEAISYGPLTTTPTHSPIPTYTGSGSLLQGYCNTPDYVLLDGPTALWAPVIGCENDKTDCCPYAVAQQTDTAVATGGIVTVISTITVDVGAGATQTAYTGLYAYPVAISADEASLQQCPNDYQTVSGGCCPSGYQLWNAVLGGQVPCYSSLSDFLPPPAVPVAGYQTPISIPISALATTTSTTSSTSSEKLTSAVINVVFAVQYPLAPAQGLSIAAKAGIAAGSSIAGIVIIVLALLLIWRTRKHNKDKKMHAPSQATGQGSIDGLGSTTGQRQSVMSSVSPNQSVQTPRSFVPQETYFPPPQMQQMQQMQQGFPPQNYYGQQPVQYMQQGQVQPPVQYSSAPPPTVSAPPLSVAGYSNQGGYLPPGSVSGHSPSSTGSQGPAPQGYGYQPNYAPAQITRKPVPTSPTSSPPQGQGYGYPAEMSARGEQVQQTQQPQQIQYGQGQELHGQSNPGEMGS